MGGETGGDIGGEGPSSIERVWCKNNSEGALESCEWAGDADRASVVGGDGVKLECSDEKLGKLAPCRDASWKVTLWSC
jgi:hypothetical protein